MKYIKSHFHNNFQAPTKPKEPSNSLKFKKQPLSQAVISNELAPPSYLESALLYNFYSQNEVLPKLNNVF